MKEIKKTFEAENVSAISVGKMEELNQFQLDLGNGTVIPGKVFGGSAVKATGAEFSFQSFAPGTETGFLHTHKTHEELYFFISGNGEFQVDGNVFSVGEGSIVRVATAGVRSVRNNGNSPLIMLCVQYKEGSFTDEDRTDGMFSQNEVKW